MLPSKSHRMGPYRHPKGDPLDRRIFCGSSVRDLSTLNPRSRPQISMVAKPRNGIFDSLNVRSRPICERRLGLGGYEEHVMFSHVNPVQSRKRLASHEVGHGFSSKCDRDESPPRKPYPCCAATDQAGDTYQHLREQYILTAEYVALAYLPITQRREMATGHVVHVHKVEPGVDKGRDAALGGFDDDPACRRGSHIARADWRRGIDDHGGKASFRHHGLHQSFGRDFAALVGADPLLLAE